MLKNKESNNLILGFSFGFNCYHCGQKLVTIISYKENFMDNYEKLIIQIREAAEEKEIKYKMDYTTDLLVKDWLFDLYKDWGGLLLDLENSLNSAIDEIKSKLDSDISILENETSIEKLDLILEKYDEKFMNSDEAEFDPFDEVNFNEGNGHGKIKTFPSDEKYEINGEADLKKYRRNYRLMLNICWLVKQKIRIKLCQIFFEKEKDTIPYKKPTFESSIPFLGHQDMFTSFVYLLNHAGFFLSSNKSNKELEKSFGILTAQSEIVKRHYAITQKELIKIMSNSFHGVTILKNNSNNGFEGTQFSFKASSIERNFKSTLSSIDAKVINEMIERFEVIISELKEVSKLKKKKD